MKCREAHRASQSDFLEIGRREAEGYFAASFPLQRLPGRQVQLSPVLTLGGADGSEFPKWRGETEFSCQRVVSRRTLFPLNHPFC